jgi:ethanolamine permease
MPMTRPPNPDAPTAAASAPPNANAPEAGGHLKRVLRPIHLWGIAVGLVISGDYFGWNLGLGQAGPVGLLIAVALVTLMYVCFIFSYTELSTAIPHSGGPYAYARRALGPVAGLIAGVATLIEFVFAPPAIALSIGSYVQFRVPWMPVKAVAALTFLAFAALNCWGVELAARFELFVTALAVFELGVFFAITGPHVETARIFAAPLLPYGTRGIFLALPFAIWFYLALEGVAMSAEEVIDPKRDIPKGYTAGLLTLVVLALGTLVCTTGVTPWRDLLQDDSPLPRAMARVLSPGHPLTHMMIYIGLFGLLASFHGIMMGYSRQVFALARAGYLPPIFARLHPTRRTPIWAVIGPAIFGLLVVLFGDTNQAITLAAVGATILYVVSMISLFVLRRRAPDLERPYRAPFYPLFPALALALATVCLVAVVWSAPQLGAACLGLFLLAGLYYRAVAKKRVESGAESQAHV